MFCDMGTKSFMPSRSLQEKKKKKKREERWRRSSVQVGEISARTGVCEVLGVLAQSEAHAQGAFLREGGKEDSELKGAQVSTRCSMQDVTGVQDCWTQSNRHSRNLCLNW